MRLLLDEHLSPRRVGNPLAKRGHDVVATAALPAYAGLTDEELLERATAEDRIVVTRNGKDFERIARRWASTGRQHAGILLIWTRRTDEFGTLVREIQLQLDAVPDQSAWRDLVLAL